MWLRIPSDMTDEVEKTGTAAPCLTSRKCGQAPRYQRPKAVMAMAMVETDIIICNGRWENSQSHRLPSFEGNLGDVQ